MIFDTGCMFGKDTIMTLLWSNPDPAVAFDGTTIEIDRSGYRLLAIVTRDFASGDFANETTILVNDPSITYQHISVKSTSSLCWRTITLNDTGIQFSNLGSCESFTSGVASTYSTDVAIPVCIYGLR